MSMQKTAKLFKNGSSQAVRLPQEFRFQGDKVRIRRLGTGVLLEPISWNVKEWFARMDSHGSFEIEIDRELTKDREIFD